MPVTLSDDQIKAVQHASGNRWNSVRVALGITDPLPAVIPDVVPDTVPVDRAGRVMVDEAGETIPVEERENAW